MSINKITRREIVIGRSGVAETYNSHFEGISVDKTPSGAFSLVLPAEGSMGAAPAQQVWFTVIDNVADLSHFNSIDAYVNTTGDTVVAYSMGAPTGLVRLAIYEAF